MNCFISKSPVHIVLAGSLKGCKWFSWRQDATHGAVSLSLSVDIDVMKEYPGF